MPDPPSRARGKQRHDIRAKGLRYRQLTALSSDHPAIVFRDRNQEPRRFRSLSPRARSPTPSENLVAGAFEAAAALARQQQELDVSSSEKLLDATTSEELITSSKQTEPHDTIDDSSSTVPFESEKPFPGTAESAYAETLQEPDDSSSEELLDTASLLEESIVATTETVPHNTTGLSLSSASSPGSTILARSPPNWYQTFYIRMDRGGSFHMYPDLGGPFQSLLQAEHAISHHLNELKRSARFMEQHEASRMERIIQNYLFYPDGTPKRGPDSPASKNPDEDERQLVRALLDQYNDDRSLSGDLLHELKDLLSFQWIFEGHMIYYHFNFTTKTKRSEDNLFFAEVSQMRTADDWVVSCCCMIEPKDDGHCFGCRNNGTSKTKHPNNIHAYAGGHMNGYMPFGGDDISDSDDEDVDAIVARLKFMFNDGRSVGEKIFSSNEASAGEQ
ncbi:hypothetical protein ACP70R_042781 [Stipagrostis hirtigluma subsp. patula]